MGYTKKTLQELDLIDNFLSNAIAANEEINEPFYRLLLSVLLGKKIKKVRVRAQQIVPPITPDLRGIRMDVEITEYDEETVTNVYDLEPHIKDSLHLPRHNRYYQAKIDGRYVKRGLKDFSSIPNLYIITITNYDLFGEDYMVYTIHNKCEEVPELNYDDGLKFIYFNTKGQKGGSQAIKNMLTYFQNSDSKNAVDDATRMMDFYVNKVKNLPEVEDGYMTLGEWMDDMLADMAKEAAVDMAKDMAVNMAEDIAKDMAKDMAEDIAKDMAKDMAEDMVDGLKEKIKENAKKEIEDTMSLKSIILFIETVHEYHGTKESAIVKIQEKFPEYSEQAEELVEKYWKES